jgi:hypothetical protein
MQDYIRMSLREVGFENDRWMELYPIAGFDVTGVELSDSVTKELVTFITRHFREGISYLFIF